MKLKDGIPQIEHNIYDDIEDTEDVITREEISKLHDYWVREIDHLKFKMKVIMITLFIIACFNIFMRNS